MPIQDSINQMLGTAAAATFAVNKALDPSAAEFEKEAEELRQNQIEASNDYISNQRPEMDKQIEEAKKADTDLEVYKRGIDESGADPTAGQQKYMKGLEKKASKLTDLEAGKRATEELEEKRQAIIEGLRKRMLNNKSILQRFSNNRLNATEDFHKKNVMFAKAKAMEQGGNK